MSKSRLEKSQQQLLSSAKITTITRISPYELRSLGQKSKLRDDIDDSFPLPKSPKIQQHSSYSLRSGKNILFSPAKKLTQIKESSTPISRKLKLAYKASEEYGFDTPEKSGTWFNTLFCTFGVKASNSTPVKAALEASVTFDKPLDMIAHTAIVHKTVIDACGTPKTLEFNILFKHIGVLVKQTIKIYDSQTMSPYIRNIGTYEAIGQKLCLLGRKLKVPDSKLADFIFDIMHKKPIPALEAPDAKDDLNFLTNLCYLLFSVEICRNPSAAVTNAAFLDLVKLKQLKFSDIAKVLPMAMKSAQPASRGIGENLCKHFVKDFKPMDFSSTRVAKIDSAEVGELLSRTESLAKLWLKAHNIVIAPKEYVNDTKLKRIAEKLKDLIENWYNIELKDFPVISSDIGAKTLDFSDESYDCLAPQSSSLSVEEEAMELLG